MHNNLWDDDIFKVILHIKHSPAHKEIKGDEEAYKKVNKQFVSQEWPQKDYLALKVEKCPQQL